MSGLRNLLPDPLHRRRAPLLPRLAIWAGIIFFGAALVVTGAYHLDAATESAEFCGLLCHPNRPQYETHQISPHANVECGECHIGPGLMPKVMAKVYGTGELVSLVTNSYERPIEPPVARLRPADEICEQCHRPEREIADQVLRVARFADDRDNTETRSYLTTRIGPDVESDASYVHWHIENPVWFVALDPAEQQIPWAAVREGGELVEYIDRDSALTLQELAALPTQEMDCLDCHNRPAHRFINPERRLDEALASGVIDRTLPFAKREGMRLLSTPYATQAAGVEAMQQLDEYYRSQHPEVYTEKQQAVAAAVAELQTIYRQTTFPEMNLTWDAYPDNSQHVESEGCFRCHDDRHVSAQGEAIPQNCSLCHSVPVVEEPSPRSEVDGLLTFVAQAKPDSHREARFLTDHVASIDASCTDCHGTITYGTDNSSFCANGVCHAPAETRAAPPTIPHLVREQDNCLTCHGTDRLRPVPVDHVGWRNEACLACHESS